MAQIDTKYLLATEGTCLNGYTDCKFGVCILPEVVPTPAAPLKTTAQFAVNVGNLLTSLPKRAHIPRNVLFIPETPADLSVPVPADSVFRPFPARPTIDDLKVQVELGFDQVTPSVLFAVQITVKQTGEKTVFQIDRLNEDGQVQEAPYRS